MVVHRYKIYLIAFLINALVLASISSISIETRLAIENAPNEPDKLSGKILYYLRILPYKIAGAFKLQDKNGSIPNWIKLIYTFLFTFAIALSVYHIFLNILGYKKVYKYFFGNFADPVLKK